MGTKIVIFDINDDILGRCKIRATFASPTFGDKGRLQAHGNGVEIWLPPGQSLSRAQEQDCHLMENKSGPRHS